MRLICNWLILKFFIEIFLTRCRHPWHVWRPGITARKSGTRPSPGLQQKSGKIHDPGRVRGLKIPKSELGPGLRIRGILGLNFEERSRGPNLFRDTIPIPCRHIFLIRLLILVLDPLPFQRLIHFLPIVFAPYNITFYLKKNTWFEAFWEILLVK